MPTVMLADDPILFKVIEATVLRRRACRLQKAPAERLAAAALAVLPDLIFLAIAGASDVRFLEAIASERSLAHIPILALDLRARRRREPAGRSRPTRRAAPITVVWVGPDPDAAPGGTIDALLQDSLRSSIGLSARGPERRSAGLPVRFRARSGSYAARTKDVSEAGVFLKTPQRLVRGERLDLKVSLPGARRRSTAHGARRARVVAAAGRVVRLVGVEESDLIPGAGVRFTHIEASDRAALRRFLQEPPAGGGRTRDGARAAG